MLAADTVTIPQVATSAQHESLPCPARAPREARLLLVVNGTLADRRRRQRARAASPFPLNQNALVMNSITTRTRTQYQQASGSNATAGWNVARMLLWGVCWGMLL